MIEIALKDVEKSYGANRILESVSFEIQTGERVGLIGRNGAGKTTLFKIITGMEKNDAGDVMLRKGATTGYLDQIPEVQDCHSVQDVLDSAFAELFARQDQLSKMERGLSLLSGTELESALKRYGELQQMFEQMGGYNIAEKVSKVCTGLKITESFRKREFRTLSGGEKTTVLLGKILLQNPDVLLLDEPTNHLDMDSIEWLEEYLVDYQGTVIIISHDRYFLDRVLNRVIEIEDGKAETYCGNYSYFAEEKQRKLQAMLEEYNQQQKKIAQLEKAAHNLREWGKSADNPFLHRRAVNIERRIERMEKIDKPSLNKPSLKLSFSQTKPAGKDVIRIKNLHKTFKDKEVLRGAELLVRYAEKVAILGKNGTGKSTMIKILLGLLEADRGDVYIGPSVKIAYLEQNVSFTSENNNIIEELREHVSVDEGQARQILAKFLFRGDDVFKKVSNLSGGEKSRLRLCLLMQQDINLLLLDEPTNHLDIESREVLEQALDAFKGTIVFISHDRYFINQLAARVVELRDGKLFNYPGDYDYYKETKQRENLELVQPVKQEIKKEARQEWKNRPEKIKQKNLTQLRKVEEQIAVAEDAIKLKEGEMEAHVADYSKLQELLAEKNALQSELDNLMVKWLELSEAVVDN